MKTEILKILQKDSELTQTDVESVAELSELALDYSPEEIYLTGSSVKNEDYNDVYLCVNFSEGEFNEELVNRYLEDLDDSTRIGASKSSRGKKRVIVKGNYKGSLYDIFILEDNNLPSDVRLDLRI